MYNLFLQKHRLLLVLINNLHIVVTLSREDVMIVVCCHNFPLFLRKIHLDSRRYPCISQLRHSEGLIILFLVLGNDYLFPYLVFSLTKDFSLDYDRYVIVDFF